MDMGTIGTWSSLIIGSASILIALLAVIIFWIEQRAKRKSEEQDRKLKNELHNLDLDLKREENALRNKQLNHDKEAREEFRTWLGGQIRYIDEVSLRIALGISNRLAENPQWATTALDAAKLMPYAQTVFGSRLQHFKLEKQLIAEKFVPILLERCRSYINSGKEVVLLVDSGTTTYSLLDRLAQAIVACNNNGDSTFDKLLVVTNNLPGVEVLIEKGRVNPNKRHSPLAVNCRLLPGNPLPVYSAILGDIANSAVAQLCEEYHSKNAVIIGLVTGNWIRLRRSNPLCPVPLARGDGHFEFKQKIIEASHEVYVVSPLGKIFMDVPPEAPNTALGFSKNHPNPDKEAYEEIKIDNKDAMKVKLVTTVRNRGNLLSRLSERLKGALGDYRDERQDGADMGGNNFRHILLLFDQLPESLSEQQMVEFPHDHTRHDSFMRDYFFV